MKKTVFYFVILGFVISCKEDEKVFPIEPYIEFRNLEFKDVTDPSRVDTLRLEFYFRDGDSDLGLDPTETKEPFNPKDYYSKSTGKKFRFSEDYYSEGFKNSLINKLPVLITFKDRRTIEMDTLPKFVKPFNCKNWEVLTKNQQVIDTVYFTSNLNFHNIFIDFFIQTNAGWELFNFDSFSTYPMCEMTGFNGRFPRLENFNTTYNTGPFSIRNISKREAIMTFKMISAGFKFVFLGKKIKLKIRIQDRDFHKSNEIETSEIQF